MVTDLRMFLDILMHHVFAVSPFQTCWDLSLDDVVDTILEQCDFKVSADQQ